MWIKTKNLCEKDGKKEQMWMKKKRCVRKTEKRMKKKMRKTEKSIKKDV